VAMSVGSKLEQQQRTEQKKNSAIASKNAKKTKGKAGHGHGVAADKNGHGNSKKKTTKLAPTRSGRSKSQLPAAAASVAVGYGHGGGKNPSPSRSMKKTKSTPDKKSTPKLSKVNSARKPKSIAKSSKSAAGGHGAKLRPPGLSSAASSNSKPNTKNGGSKKSLKPVGKARRSKTEADQGKLRLQKSKSMAEKPTGSSKKKKAASEKSKKKAKDSNDVGRNGKSSLKRKDSLIKPSAVQKIKAKNGVNGSSQKRARAKTSANRK